MIEATPLAAGAVSNDGEFEWDGRGWVARGSRGASAWTRPLQLAASTYLLLLAASSLAANFLLGNASPARLREAYLKAGVGSEQAQSMAQGMTGVVLVMTLIFAAVYLFLAFASWRGWRWAFWADGVVLLLGGFAAFANLGSLGRPGAATLLSEAVSICAVVLLAWFVAGFFRYGFGAWARTRG
jgi:hypothetical protein